MKTCKTCYTWNKKSAGADLTAALETLAVRYPALAPKTKGATEIVFEKSEDESICSVAREDGKIVISYGKLNMALRMVGAVLSGTMADGSENCPFKMLGIMLDCSRDAVMTVDHLKSYLDRLAILGYNMVMLYTEETYELPGEPMFGFMRGAYTKAEIREIDDHAARLGIEIIPCIQALAHLEQIFRWGNYEEIHDINGVLLVDEPKTYALIEKMLAFWKSAVRSRRIHLGMDEAHGLGTGKYARLHGEKSAFEVINAHLKKVCALCEKHGFRPMIWSDMYFRIGSKYHSYYDVDSQFPQDIIDGIPKGLQLVYWDYYHVEEGTYDTFIDMHRKLAGDPIMGSAVWTWNRFWYDPVYTSTAAAPCLKACRKAKLDEVFFTMWGDGGGFCDFDSAFAGLAYTAELAFTGDVDEAILAKKLAALFRGASYEAISALGKLSCFNLPPFLFDDPIMLFYTRGYRNQKGTETANDGVHDFPPYRDLEKAAPKVKALLDKTPLRGDAGDMKLARALIDMIVAKCAWAKVAFEASKKKDMRAAIREGLPFAKDYRKAAKAFYRVFCEMWHDHNKPFGLESIQIRLNGQVCRADELVSRLEDFLASEETVFPEFAQIARAGKEIHMAFYQPYTRVACATTIF